MLVYNKNTGRSPFRYLCILIKINQLVFYELDCRYFGDLGSRRAVSGILGFFGSNSSRYYGAGNCSIEFLAEERLNIELSSDGRRHARIVRGNAS